MHNTSTLKHGKDETNTHNHKKKTRRKLTKQNNGFRMVESRFLGKVFSPLLLPLSLVFCSRKMAGNCVINFPRKLKLSGGKEVISQGV